MKKLLTIVSLTKNNPNQLLETLNSVLNYKLIIENSKILIINGSYEKYYKDYENIYLYFKRIYDLNFINEKKKGIYISMNKAIRNIDSEFILFMNSGDIFSHELDEKLLIKNLLLYKTDKKVKLIYCRTEINSKINPNINYFNPAKFMGYRQKRFLPYLVPPSHQACFFKTKWHKKNYYKLDTEKYLNNPNREYYYDPYISIDVFIKNS